MNTTKKCSKCGVVKLVSEFYKDKRRKDGLYSHCKKCQNAITKAYSSTEKGKAIHKRQYKKWYDEQGGKEWQREYAKSSAARDKRSLTRGTEESKAKRRSYYLRYKLENPGAVEANVAIRTAVRRGDIPPANAHKCAECGEQASDFHHWSYEKDDWLDVVPYCHDCHMQLHAEL